MSNNELLLSISGMLDKKLMPVNDRLKQVVSEHSKKYKNQLKISIKLEYILKCELH